MKQTKAPADNARTVWQASKDNGDKPGFGLELVNDAGRISGTFFLLDPNKQRDFKAGRAFPTEVTQSGQSELHFVVHLDDNRKDEFVIVLQGPLKGKNVDAILRDFDETRKPLALAFVRQ